MATIKAQKSGKPPEPTITKTEPYPDLAWAWNAFWHLSNKRPQGFNGPLRIPDSEILAKVRLDRWDYEKAQDFCFYCDKLDGAYMGHVAKLQEEEDRKKKAEGGSTNPRRR